MIRHPEDAATRYPELPRQPLDIAVMKKCTNLIVAEATFDWDDLGTLEALAACFEQDENRNRIQGQVTAVDSRDCIVCSTDPNHTVTLLGATKLAVVHTPTNTLVIPRPQLPNIRELLK